jgi:hypothetical protein
MRLFILFICLYFVISSCKTSETISPSNSSSNPFNSVPSSIPGVYVGGFDKNTGKGKIWKNEEVFFSSTNLQTSSVEDIFVSENDVYAVGWEYYEKPTNDVFDKNWGKEKNATLWKNGVLTILGNKLKPSVAHSVFVNGKDVYVCGYQQDMAGNDNAVIWKNGIPSIIEPYGELYTIFVFGNDVYASGVTGKGINSGLNIGLSIFKNGKSIYYEKDGGYPTGMFVSGTDVYVSGYGNFQQITQAKLWKNGVLTILDKANKESTTANDVFVSGSDVYVVGSKSLTNSPGSNIFTSLAILWKNGIATNLTNGSTNAKANDIFVSGNDIYVCGGEDSNLMVLTQKGKIWKNGLDISKTSNSLLFFNRIFVVK